MRLRGFGLIGAGLLLSLSALGAQTVITPPPNKYTPAQDVELGRQAAAEVEHQLPILHNDEVTAEVEAVGQRLVDKIPEDLQHPEFHYTFEVVNVREINAFALPGGPMYVNRGMIEAAKSEAEMAGVMAHEMSHVALRHGTSQATKATKYEVGQLLGAVVGSIIGGKAGAVVSQGTQFGLGTAFLRFGREAEQQADLLGSHIMAAAGYDPREMANMFKTIEKEGGSGGPQWLSDHPNPGNRYDYITKEAELLDVRNPIRQSRQFTDARAVLQHMPKAPTTEQATKNAEAASGGAPGGPVGGSRAPGERVPAPSSNSRTYTEGDVFRVSVPANWNESASNSAVTFAPDGAFSGQGSFSHGMQMGVARNEGHDVRTATDELIASLASSNPNLRRTSGYSGIRIGGRAGVRTVLSNAGPNGAEERVAIFSAPLSDGSLFYAIGVAPSDQFSDYDATFRQVVASVQFTNLTN